VFVEGGWKGRILLSEGCDGRGWSWFAGEGAGLPGNLVR
jgi:hypothetical protein